jgi:hypothetical protein
MHILRSGRRLSLALLLVTAAGALAFALAPDAGGGSRAMAAITAALLVLEIGLGVADHLRSSHRSDLP